MNDSINPTGDQQKYIDNNKHKPLLSIITPAYCEEENIPLLYSCLLDVTINLGVHWEWIVIDDHSSDNTFKIIKDLSLSNPRIRGVRLSRNHGSHAAISCGLHLCQGDCAIIMAADLQDPPEIIPLLLEKWIKGFQVVWAVREKREGLRKHDYFFAQFYYCFMRKIIDIQNIHPSGADFFLIDRLVINTIKRFSERNRSIFALIAWVGFNQGFIEYEKKNRIHGKSGWNYRKKIILLIDSITSFSYLPIRFISTLGIVTAVIGFIYSLFTVINALTGNPPEGWASLMVAVLIIGGIQMMMLGILGEYLWRTLDESRQRPQYIIEETTY